MHPFATIEKQLTRRQNTTSVCTMIKKGVVHLGDTPCQESGKRSECFYKGEPVTKEAAVKLKKEDKKEDEKVLKNKA